MSAVVRNALFAFALVCVACASDPEPSDTLDTPTDAAGGGVDVAGHGALAGAGGTVANDAAGSASTVVAGAGEQTSAGAGAVVGAHAGESGSLSGSAAGGGGVGGSGGVVEVAGSGAAGSSAAGSSGQAGAAGASAPVVHELWTVTQNEDASVTTVRAPSDVTARLVPSGSGSMPATTLAWTFTRGEPLDHTFTMIPGKTTVEAAYIACGSFQSMWNADGDPNTHGGVVHAETPAHVTYVRVVGSASILGSAEAWTLSVHLTWTAYGY